MECCQCSCKEYVSEQPSVKCAFCTHVPMSHRVIDDIQNQENEPPTNLSFPEESEGAFGQMQSTSEDNTDAADTREVLVPTAKQIIDITESKDKSNDQLPECTSIPKVNSAKIKRLRDFLQELFSKEDGRQYTIESEKSIVCNVCNLKITLGNMSSYLKKLTSDVHLTSLKSYHFTN